MTTLRLAPTLGLLLSVFAAGCFGTEGGNPYIVDAGPSWGDASTCSADAAAAPPVCERPGSLPAECTCAPGAPVPLAAAPRGYGQRTSLVGPTAAGAFVALHASPCLEPGCTTEVLTTALAAQRFDAAGDPIGEPIEVTRSVAAEHAVIVDGTTLAIAFADSRASIPGFSNLWFAHLDLTSGAWIVEPRLALETQLPLMRVRIARAAGGYGVVYSVAGDVDGGGHFVRLDDGGSVVAGPVHLVERWDPIDMAIAPRGDGFALLRSSRESVFFVPLTADGAEAAAPVTLATSSPGTSIRVNALRPSGAGYIAGWRTRAGADIARLDANGAIVGSPIEMPGAMLIDVVEEASGVIAATWMRLPCFGGVAVDFDETLLLSRFGPTGAPLHPDVVLHRDTGSAAVGGDLVDTADGLRTAYTATLDDEGSTAWIVAACVPLAAP